MKGITQRVPLSSATFVAAMMFVFGAQFMSKGSSLVDTGRERKVLDKLETRDLRIVDSHDRVRVRIAVEPATAHGLVDRVSISGYDGSGRMAFSIIEIEDYVELRMVDQRTHASYQLDNGGGVFTSTFKSQGNKDMMRLGLYGISSGMIQLCDGEGRTSVQLGAAIPNVREGSAGLTILGANRLPLCSLSGSQQKGGAIHLLNKGE